MTVAKKVCIYVFLFILTFGTISSPAFALETTEIEPYANIALCPKCNVRSFAKIGPISRSWRDTPTICDVHIGGPDHTHVFSESYTLYQCSSCGYEELHDYYGSEYCEITGINLKWER